jgi:DNA polymerase-1
MEASGLDEYLLLPVHDEVVADVPRELADEVSRAIAECMSDDETYRVKISAGADILPERWQKV